MKAWRVIFRHERGTLPDFRPTVEAPTYDEAIRTFNRQWFCTEPGWFLLAVEEREPVGVIFRA